MPNTTVRAAAEGLPKFNRRSVLGGLAAATAVVAAPNADAAEIVPAPIVAEPQSALSAAEQARWHLSQAHRLMEEVTGFHYDFTLQEELGFALLIQRDTPSQWHAAPSADGSRETVLCTYLTARAGDAA